MVALLRRIRTSTTTDDDSSTSCSNNGGDVVEKNDDTTTSCWKANSCSSSLIWRNHRPNILCCLGIGTFLLAFVLCQSHLITSMAATTATSQTTSSPADALSSISTFDDKAVVVPTIISTTTNATTTATSTAGTTPTTITPSNNQPVKHDNEKDGLQQQQQQQDSRISTKKVIPTTTAKYCSSTHHPHNIDSSLFHSQSGEDKKLLSTWFTNVCNGTYIEMGALDGSKYSNTYVFNHPNSHLQWKGILIEPSPMMYRKLLKNRPNELIPPKNVAICSHSQNVHFIQSYHSVVSNGIWEFADSKFKQKWWSNPKKIKSNTTIQCLPLQDIISLTNESYDYPTTTTTTTTILPPSVPSSLRNQNHHHVDEEQEITTTTTTDNKKKNYFFDIFSLDVEGSEMEILSTLDFTSINFGIILIESSSIVWRNQQIIKLLTTNGYHFLYDELRSLWFQHEDFNTIYHDIIQNSTAKQKHTRN